MSRRVILATMVLVVACVTTPATSPVHERSAAELSDRLGDSQETAIEVPGNAPNEGIDFMNNAITPASSSSEFIRSRMPRVT